MKRVDWALQYARQGYRVMPAFVIENKGGKPDKVCAAREVLLLPCSKHKGKIGTEEAAACRHCKGGSAAATTSEKYIRWMWGRYERGPLVALVPPPGVVILDDDSFVFDLLWGTRPRVRSQSGKHHYWLRLAEGQRELPSENGILFTEPDGKVDLRSSDGSRWIFAPCGKAGKYQPENGWASDPAGLPVLPQSVYRRLCEAPRASGGTGGGPGGAGWAAGLPVLSPYLMGIGYDREPGEAEQILERHGWTSDDDGEKWTRPGSSSSGHGQLTFNDDGVWFFSVYSTSDEFLHGDRWYTPSMLRAVLDYGGDWRETYIQLTKEGHPPVPFDNIEE